MAKQKRNTEREAQGNRQIEDLKREIEEANKARQQLENEKRKLHTDYSDMKQRGKTGK